MKKLFAIAASLALLAGCAAQNKPEPTMTPTTEPSAAPETTGTWQAGIASVTSLKTNDARLKSIRQSLPLFWMTWAR